jgi:uncharacterized membrane protein YhaH (DUF805 family)
MAAMLSLMFLPFGRASRITFLGGIGAFMLLSQLVMMAQSTLYTADFRRFGVFFLTMPTLALGAWVMFCLFANRLHDIGRSALWAVIPVFAPTFVMSGLLGFNQNGFGWGAIMTMFFGPVLYVALAVVLLFFRGHDWPNRFGVRPAIA